MPRVPPPERWESVVGLRTRRVRSPARRGQRVSVREAGDHPDMMVGRRRRTGRPSPRGGRSPTSEAVRRRARTPPSLGPASNRSADRWIDMGRTLDRTRPTRHSKDPHRATRTASRAARRRKVPSVPGVLRAIALRAGRIGRCAPVPHRAPSNMRGRPPRLWQSSACCRAEADSPGRKTHVPIGVLPSSPRAR